MAEFSIQDVAFTGFGVVRHHPRVLVPWTLLSLVLSLTLGVILVELAGRDLVEMLALSQQRTPDPSVALALMGRLLPAYAVMAAVALAFNAILWAAMIRAVLRPSDDRFGYLRLGADELRQLGLGLLTFLVFMGLYLAVVVAVSIVVGVITALTKGAPGMMVWIVALLVAAAMVFLGVRFSLAPPLTFDSGRINLFGSWTLTRGQFWRLCGAYLLTFALTAVVYLLSLLVVAAIVAIVAGQGSMGQPLANMASLAAYLAPASLAQTALGAVVSALIWPLIFTPPAAIYRALTPAASTADAFA